MIKKDAVIDIKIGTGFIQKLQQLLMHITSELTPEEIEKYKQEAATIKDISHEFSEPWMNSLTTISILLRDIETEADKQGKSYDGSIDDVVADTAS